MPRLVDAIGRLPDHPLTRWPPDTQLYRPDLTLTHLVRQRPRLCARPTTMKDPVLLPAASCLRRCALLQLVCFSASCFVACGTADAAFPRSGLVAGDGGAGLQRAVLPRIQGERAFSLPAPS